ncbi:MAG TPA: S1/P1 nuclease [Gemmatimonadales bacterium]|nr:S1/P1 nuclease [Gemmatimonadales bacterium]
MWPYLFALTLLSPRPAAPLPRGFWFDFGHRLVADIAARRLTPAATGAVRDLLGGQSMADVASWADEVRGARRETAPLHYVNIPLAAAQYDSANYCPGGECIIAAIARYRAELADAQASPVERTEALKFLIHLVGDLHQPLHVSNHGDRGGNTVDVTFYDEAANLHKVWDGMLLEHTRLDEAEYLARLERQMSGFKLDQVERGTVIDWAMEGHARAARIAYRIPANRVLGDAYEQADLPVADSALIEAGVRLARVLNEALVNYRPPPSQAPLGTGIYRDREAAAHVGEEATVVGTVVSVHQAASGNIHINFGAEYPHQTFSVYIAEPVDPSLRGLESLVGKRIAVKGEIRLFRGSAEMTVTSRNQISDQP